MGRRKAKCDVMNFVVIFVNVAETSRSRNSDMLLYKGFLKSTVS